MSEWSSFCKFVNGCGGGGGDPPLSTDAELGKGYVSTSPTFGEISRYSSENRSQRDTTYIDTRTSSPPRSFLVRSRTDGNLSGWRLGDHGSIPLGSSRLHSTLSNHRYGYQKQAKLSGRLSRKNDVELHRLYKDGSDILGSPTLRSRLAAHPRPPPNANLSDWRLGDSLSLPLGTDELQKLATKSKLSPVADIQQAAEYRLGYIGRNKCVGSRALERTLDRYEERLQPRYRPLRQSFSTSFILNSDGLKDKAHSRTWNDRKYTLEETKYLNPHLVKSPVRHVEDTRYSLQTAAQKYTASNYPLSPATTLKVSKKGAEHKSDWRYTSNFFFEKLRRR